MKFIVRDSTPFKTIVACAKMYLIIKHCVKDNPEEFRLKGIALYLGTHGEEDLNKEMGETDG